MSMPTVMDARIALHVLRSWARERVENRQEVAVVVDGAVVRMSPCEQKGEDGWRFDHPHYSRDRWTAGAEALDFVERAEAVIVPESRPSRDS